MLPRILRAARLLDQHWIGDLIGAVSLFAIAYGLLFIGWGVGLK